MADSVVVGRLHLRLPFGTPGASGLDARRLATHIAEALAAGAPELDPGAVIPELRVRLAHPAAANPASLGQDIAAAVLRRLDASGR
jgi:hypothetical protein